MDISPLITGLIAGFSIAAPVGPIGLLCISRTLRHGGLAGFVSGMGAATADALYGMVAAFGVAGIAPFLDSITLWVRIAGGLFLGYLGIRQIMASASPKEADAGTGSGLLFSYLSTLMLTVTNPATILSFAAMIAALGLTGSGTGGGFLLVTGVFGGSALWWLVLSFLAHSARQHLNEKSIRRINTASGLFLCVFALYALSGITL